MMVNWEFFDNQTPESAKQLVDDLRAGKDGPPDPRRRRRLCTWQGGLAGPGRLPDGRPATARSAGRAARCAGLEDRQGATAGQAPEPEAR